ncbi:MAG: hypothetical protein QOF97_112, partial [Acidimicrobiaceae bacterium]
MAELLSAADGLELMAAGCAG